MSSELLKPVVNNDPLNNLVQCGHGTSVLFNNTSRTASAVAGVRFARSMRAYSARDLSSGNILAYATFGLQGI